ncbi:MAG: SDR family oxidoreductase, partial [Haloechinothrix sp.]
PSAPLSLSDATVADVAEVLDGLPTATEGPAGAAAAGVRGWVRQFEVTWTPFETIPSEPSAARMDVTLPNDASPAHVAQLLTRIAAQQPARLLVVHSGHPAASGIGRSVAAELPECRVTVIETPRGNVSNPAIDYPAIDHPDRYAELRTRPDGSLERAVVRARRTTGPGDLELKLDGVCLVTGGVRGITAYAAAELAQRMACKLVFVGRSPAEDPEIVRALHDLEPARYLTCDITDQAAVQAMVATAREHGPIRGIIHGAGVNEPRTLGDVTAESFQRTHAPKVDGLRNLLAALGDAGDDLRLLLGFGSIIGRQGLAGQAEYCIANDWLRADIEAWARTHPHCRTHLLEWSVWSGIGMGLRLGVLDNLRRMGVEPIGPRHGVDALLEVLTDREAPVTVLVASRFPATATLRVDGEDAPLLRFGERVRTRLPGVEVIIEADLTLGSDPYLDDHRIDGTPVLPAVVAMEAMAQAAAHVRRPPSAESPWSFSHLDLRAPVTVGGPDQRT